jgi:hypothetical protein
MGKIVTRKNTKEEIRREVDTAMLETDMIMVGFHRADNSIIKFLAIDKAESMKKMAKFLKEL